MKNVLTIAGFLTLVACQGASDRGAGSPDADADSDADAGTDADTDADADADGGADTEALGGCSAIDILFVVDNSGSMLEEQANLAANFPNFIDVIEAIETPSGAPVTYRVGVTTTAVSRDNFVQKVLGMSIPVSTTGQDGALQGQTACGLGEHPWLDGPGDTDANATLGCMAAVGSNGSGYEMPLAAIELALGGQMAPGGPNEGFFPSDEDALLVIVVITDEDECSIEEGGTMTNTMSGATDCDQELSTGLYDLAAGAEFVSDVAGGEGRYVVVGIAGPGPGACSSSFGDAVYAVRLAEFIAMFGEYGVFGDICDGDLSTGLTAALEVIDLTCDEFPPVE